MAPPDEIPEVDLEDAQQDGPDGQPLVFVTHGGKRVTKPLAFPMVMGMQKAGVWRVKDSGPNVDADPNLVPSSDQVPQLRADAGLGPAPTVPQAAPEPPPTPWPPPPRGAPAPQPTPDYDPQDPGGVGASAGVPLTPPGALPPPPAEPPPPPRPPPAPAPKARPSVEVGNATPMPSAPMSPPPPPPVTAPAPLAATPDAGVGGSGRVDPMAAMQEARGKSDQLRLLAGLDRAEETFTSAFAHKAPDYKSSANLEAEAGQPEAEAMQDMQLRAQQEQSDPNSQTNQRAREAFASVAPEIAKSLGPRLQTLTKGDLEKLMPLEGKNADRALKEREYGVKDREYRDNLQRQTTRDTAETAHWKAMEAAARANSGSGGGGFTPEALDSLATMFHQTHQLPPMGRGGPGLRVSIMNRAAEMYPNDDLAANGANFGAEKKSLETMNTQSEKIKAFEHTALLNLTTFEQQAKRITDLGAPFLNKPMREVQSQFMGDPRLTAYNTARQVAVQEVAKVLNNATGVGVLTDSQRQDVERLIGPDSSLAQIREGVKILRTDLANRQGAMDESLRGIRGRISARPPTGSPPAARNQQPSVGATPEEIRQAREWAKDPRFQNTPQAKEILRRFGDHD